MNAASFHSEDYEPIISKNIDTIGWHVMKVEKDEYGPSYAYSIGFYKSFQHPEVIIIGPEVDIAHFIINMIGEAIVNGTTFTQDSYYPSLVQDAFLYFTPVAQQHYNYFVEHGQHYYKDSAFPLLQCVYPAPNGAYPGQQGWPKQFLTVQPYLGKEPMKEGYTHIRVPQYAIKLPLPIFE